MCIEQKDERQVNWFISLCITAYDDDDGVKSIELIQLLIAACLSDLYTITKFRSAEAADMCSSSAAMATVLMHMRCVYRSLYYSVFFIPSK